MRVQRDELRVHVVRLETHVTQVNEELAKGRGSSNEYTLIIERLRAELRESNERFSATSVEVKEIESLKRQRDHALEQLEAQHKQILDLTESIEIIRAEWKLERGKLLVEVRARSSRALSSRIVALLLHVCPVSLVRIVAPIACADRRLAQGADAQRDAHRAADDRAGDVAPR